MHELSIAQEIIEQTISIAKDNNMKSINLVHLKIGKLMQVVPDILEFNFNSLKENTICEMANLTYEIVTITINCHNCYKVSEIQEMNFICPHCQSFEIETKSGSDIIIEKIQGE